MTFFTTRPPLLHERAGAVDEFCAEEEVARGAVGLAEWRIEAGGDGAADRCLWSNTAASSGRNWLCSRSVAFNFASGMPASTLDGEVGGIVVGDLVQAGHVERDVVARGGRADARVWCGANTGRARAFFDGETRRFRRLLRRWRASRPRQELSRRRHREYDEFAVREGR